ncbi:uncharacterized protein LOC125052574 [Pieris napi]|uniref:uncharacterized protein LOC125052574 n=1 Tax=Pieris napi TaxID=78633 RepID=UPI001FBC0D7A|nr:uncharacterized protein LOC125052574 [Pieris napi]
MYATLSITRVECKKYFYIAFIIIVLYKYVCVNNSNAIYLSILLIVLNCVNSINVTLEKAPTVILKSGVYTKQITLGTLAHHVFIYRLYDKWKLDYRAFCTGSIVSEDRVLTSAHCFYTNRKRLKRGLDKIRVVGGILHTIAQQPLSHDVQQWRNPKHVYTQRFYRFPAYNLAVVEVNKKWELNQFVNKIPYSQKNYNFDGVCMGVLLKTTKSWSIDKSLFTVDLKVHNQRSCERQLLRSCWQYYCTEFDRALAATEAEGGGLVCFGTGDPAEDEKKGVLVGVTSLINRNLPSLHVRTGIFHKWVTDTSSTMKFNTNILVICIMFSQ